MKRNVCVWGRKAAGKLRERVKSALTPQALHPHDGRIHSSTITFDLPEREKNIHATLLCQCLTAQDVSDGPPQVSNAITVSKQNITKDRKIWSIADDASWKERKKAHQARISLEGFLITTRETDPLLRRKTVKLVCIATNQSTQAGLLHFLL